MDEAKISDVGLGKLIAGPCTATQQGSFYWASPEQLLGTPTTTASDMFSMATVCRDCVRFGVCLDNSKKSFVCMHACLQNKDCTLAKRLTCCQSQTGLCSLAGAGEYACEHACESSLTSMPVRHMTSAAQAWAHARKGCSCACSLSLTHHLHHPHGADNFVATTTCRSCGRSARGSSPGNAFCASWRCRERRLRALLI